MKTINIKIETELSAEGFGERNPDRLVMLTHRKEIDDLKRLILPFRGSGDDLDVGLINLKDYLERHYDDEFQMGVLLRAIYELGISIRVCNFKKRILVKVDRLTYYQMFLRFT